MLNADRHLHHLRGLAFKLHHNRYHCIRSLAHCIIVKGGIIFCSCNAILDIADSRNKDGRVLHHNFAVLAHGMHTIMTCCHVLSIAILFKQYIHSLAHEYSRRDTVLFCSLRLVIGVETVDDIAHVIYRDDTLILRETYIVSLCLLTQVIQSRKTLQVVDITAKVDIILNVDTVAFRSHGRAILLDKEQTTQPAVSCHTVL